MRGKNNRQEGDKGHTDQDENKKRDKEEGKVAIKAERSTVKASSKAKGSKIGESGPGPVGTDTDSEQQQSGGGS